MALIDEPFEVVFSCGDPRDLEHRNGLISPRAYYRQGKSINVSFRLVGTKGSESEEVRWKVEAPADLREALGPLWQRRSVILQRLTGQLEGVQFEHPYGIGGYQLKNLTVDLSKVPGWLPAYAKRARRRLAPFLRHFPSRKTAVPIAIGLVGVLVGTEQLAPPASTGVRIVLGVCGLITVARLLQEIQRDYELVSGLHSLASLGKPLGAGRSRARSALIRAFGARYAISLLLALVILDRSVR